VTRAALLVAGVAACVPRSMTRQVDTSYVAELRPEPLGAETIAILVLSEIKYSRTVSEWNPDGERWRPSARTEDSDGIGVAIENNGPDLVTILWERSAIVDADGAAAHIARLGPASTLPPGSRLSDILRPTDARDLDRSIRPHRIFLPESPDAAGKSIVIALTVLVGDKTRTVSRRIVLGKIRSETHRKREGWEGGNIQGDTAR